MLLVDYMSMVMMFYFSSQERLVHIHNQVENHLEVRLMEDHKEEEDHLAKTHLKDCRLIHLLDFMDGQHLIQE
jgi:hypothetical protein